MKNLVEQSALWLQSEACRSGNILERTNAVISYFRKYVSDEKTEICDKTGLSLSTIVGKIDQTESTIRQILSAFLRGNQLDSLQKTHKMMQLMNYASLSSVFPMYKCRENSKLFHYTKDEMFHIPYDKRYLLPSGDLLVWNEDYCHNLVGDSYLDSYAKDFLGLKLPEEIILDLEKISTTHNREVLKTTNFGHYPFLVAAKKWWDEKEKNASS